MIIEFAGLTGCGKSTLCRETIDYFKSKRLVFSYRDVNRVVARYPFKVIYFLGLLLNPSRWKYLVCLFRVKKLYSNVSVQAIYCLCSMYDISIWLEHIFPKSLIVLDEGFVQTITSISHLQPLVDNKDLIDLLCIIERKLSPFVVDCRCSSEVVLQRIRKRNSGDRFNRIRNDDELLIALDQKQRNIDVLLNHIDFKCVVDMEFETKDIVGRLIPQLEKDLNI